MSTISPGIGKYCDNIYDHRKEPTERESIRRVVASPMTKIGPEVTTEEEKKGEAGNVVGILEIGLGVRALRRRAVNVLKRWSLRADKIIPRKSACIPGWCAGYGSN